MMPSRKPGPSNVAERTGEVIHGNDPKASIPKSSQKRANMNKPPAKAETPTYEAWALTIDGRVIANRPAPWEQAKPTKLPQSSQEIYEKTCAKQKENGESPEAQFLGLGPKQKAIVNHLVNEKNESETNENAEWSLFDVRRHIVDQKQPRGKMANVTKALLVTVKRQVSRAPQIAGDTLPQNKAANPRSVRSVNKPKKQEERDAIKTNHEDSQSWDDRSQQNTLVETCPPLNELDPQHNLDEQQPSKQLGFSTPVCYFDSFNMEKMQESVPAPPDQNEVSTRSSVPPVRSSQQAQNSYQPHTGARQKPTFGTFDNRQPQPISAQDLGPQALYDDTYDYCDEFGPNLEHLYDPPRGAGSSYHRMANGSTGQFVPSSPTSLDASSSQFSNDKNKLSTPPTSLDEYSQGCHLDIDGPLFPPKEKDSYRPAQDTSHFWNDEGATRRNLYSKRSSGLQRPLNTYPEIPQPKRWHYGEGHPAPPFKNIFHANQAPGRTSRRGYHDNRPLRHSAASQDSRDRYGFPDNDAFERQQRAPKPPREISTDALIGIVAETLYDNLEDRVTLLLSSLGTQAAAILRDFSILQGTCLSHNSANATLHRRALDVILEYRNFILQRLTRLAHARSSKARSVPFTGEDLDSWFTGETQPRRRRTPLHIPNSNDKAAASDRNKAELRPTALLVKDLVEGSQGFSWALLQIERLALFSQAGEDHTAVRGKIAEALEYSPRNLGLTLVWKRKDMLRELARGDSARPDILCDTAVHIGNTPTSFSTTASEYVQYLWPEVDLRVLQCLEEAVMDNDGRAKGSIEGVQLLVALSGETTRIRLALPRDVNSFRLRKQMLEIAEVFIWLATACRENSGQNVAGLSRPHVELLARDGFSEVSMSATVTPVAQDRFGDWPGWIDLLRNPVLAVGYPLPPRGSEAS